MGTQDYGMRIAGISAYAPPRVVTNQDIAGRLQEEMERLDAEQIRTTGIGLTDEEKRAFTTNDRWIRKFIGFTERRFAAAGEGTIDLAVRAGKTLLAKLGLSPNSIGGIVFASVTPSYLYSPPDAALLQHALGIPAWNGSRPREIIGVDASLACSSWVAALHLAYRHLADTDCILIVGADRMSGTINWWDRAFACVLGDAAVVIALVRVPAHEDAFGDRRFYSWLDGSKAMVIHTPAGGSRSPDLTPEQTAAYQHRLSMDGRMVREDMVPFISGPALDAALEKAGLGLTDLDYLVLHEANRVLNRDISTALTARGFRGHVLDAEGKFGNTTSASIPLALALNPNALTVGSTIALIGFGGGYSFRSAIVTFKHPCPVFTEV